MANRCWACLGKHRGPNSVRRAMNDQVCELVQSRLSLIEQDESVKILYACESGSRAWGFASGDSDYDVRFVYVRPHDWYLAVDVEDQRDVIERPMADNLDINGWDLRK